MKRKFLLTCAAIAALFVGTQNVSADGTDVTTSYIGDLSWIVNAHGDSNAKDHNKSAGIGWWNNQTIPSGWHAFWAPGTSGTGESWTPGIGSAGTMMGRTMVLPVGKYTLKFSAFGCTASNASDKTASTAGDVVAYCTGKDNVDITNTTLGGNTFHDVTFDLDITTPNTSIEFGIKKLTDDSKADWCQIKSVSLTLNSTDITPVANDNKDVWTQTFDSEESKNGDLACNTWSTEGQKDGTDFLVPFIQVWKASGTPLSDQTISNTFTPTTTGVYKVSAWVRALNESGGAVTGAKIFVGDTEADACGGSAITNGTLGTFTSMADGVADTPIEYGIKIDNAAINWISFKNFTITYLPEGIPAADITALEATMPASDAKLDKDLKTAMNDAKTALDASKSVANYNALAVAISNANASVKNYAIAKTAADAAKAKADGAGVDVATSYDAFTSAYDEGKLNGTTESDAVLTAYQNAIVAAMTAIKTNYPNSSDEVLNTDISKWTTSTYTVMNSNQHWSGASSYKYYEQSGAQWGQDSWSIAASQTVNLPAGHYAFVVTARASADVTSTMTVNGTAVSLPTFGSVGKGIATDGTASYSDGTFANSNNGNGWEYRFVKFELTEAKDVTFSLASSTSKIQNWVSIANPTLYYQNDAKDAMELVVAKAALNTALNAVPTAPTANITETGEVFKYNKSDIDANNKVVTDAQAVYNNASATKVQVDAQTTAVKAIAYKANVLSTATSYSVKLSGNNSWTYDGKYVSFYENEAQTQGGFSIGYFDAGTKGYQTVVLTPNTETGYYTMSTVDANDVTQYVCTKTAYSESTSDAAFIRMTTDASKALAIDIQPSFTEEGIVKLYNTEASAYIGSKDEGFFTVAQNNNYAIVPAIYTRSTSKDAYGTICLPYAFSATGAKVYSASINESTKEVELAEVTTPVAGTPYIYQAEDAAQTFAYTSGAVVSAPVAAEPLVGTFADKVIGASDNAYVLQTQDKQNFYKVAADITVPANKAYITYSGSGAKLSIGFADDDATAVNAVNALVNGTAKIYDINGRQLPALRKGVNIVNGVKVVVK